MHGPAALVSDYMTKRNRVACPKRLARLLKKAGTALYRGICLTWGSTRVNASPPGSSIRRLADSDLSPLPPRLPFSTSLRTPSKHVPGTSTPLPPPPKPFPLPPTSPSPPSPSNGGGVGCSGASVGLGFEGESSLREDGAGVSGRMWCSDRGAFFSSLVALSGAVGAGWADGGDPASWSSPIWSGPLHVR